MDDQTEFVGNTLKLVLPDMRPVAVAAACVGGDEQLDLGVRDAVADVVPHLSKAGVAVGEDLRVRRQQVITLGCPRGGAGGVLPLGLLAPKVHRGVIGGAFTPCIVRKGAGS